MYLLILRSVYNTYVHTPAETPLPYRLPESSKIYPQSFGTTIFSCFQSICKITSYVPENGNTITTIHKCKDVLIGSTYKITGTITYIDDPTHEKRIAVMHTFYPCCHGRGDALGDTYTSLDFEQIDTSN